MPRPGKQARKAEGRQAGCQGRAKAELHKKSAKVEKLTKAQLAAKAKEEKLKAKAAAAKADPKKAAAAPVVPPPKPGSKIAPKKPGENETPGDADSPLLDMSDVGVRKMIAKAKARGYVTYDELNKVLPSDKTSSEQIEDTMAMLKRWASMSSKAKRPRKAREGGALVAEARKRWPPRPSPANNMTAPTIRCAWLRDGLGRVFIARGESPSPSASRPAAS
jgi:hypothetical protein